MAKPTATPARPVRTTGSRTAATRQSSTRQAPGRRTTASRTKENIPARPFQMPFDKKNMTLIFAGIGVIILGYLVMYFSPVMSTMALTISPIILLIGYLVIVPIGIMSGVHGNRKRKAAAASAEGIVPSEPVASSPATTVA